MYALVKDNTVLARESRRTNMFHTYIYITQEII